MSQFNEVFSKYCTEKLYENNTFLTYTVDVSEYSNGKKVHIPQFVYVGQTAMNGSNFTGATSYDVARPFEQDLEFENNEYHLLEPIMVSQFDQEHVTYPKLTITYGDAVSTLTTDIGKKILNTVALDVPSTKVTRTSGTLGTKNAPLRTTARKKVSYIDILSIAEQMSSDNLPEEGRFLLLDPVMYYELLQDSQIVNSNQFGETTLPEGVVRKIGGINILAPKPTISTATSSGAVKVIGGSATSTDNRVGIAWHKDAIVRSDDGIKTFQDNGNPWKRGDVFNVSYWMGCVNKRKNADNAGVYLLIQE